MTGGALLLAGCRTDGHPTPGTTTAQATTPAASAQGAQQLMAAVASAILRRDHAAYGKHLDRADPAFAALVARLWTNLGRLPVTRLRFTVAARRASPDPDRTRALGHAAVVAPATLTWRLRGQRRDAGTTGRLVFTGAGQTLRWAGASIFAPGGPGTSGTVSAGAPAVPLWWSAPVRVGVSHPGAAHPVVVVTADGAPQPRGNGWEVVVGRAVAAAAAHAPPHDAEGEPVVVEVPANADGFAHAVGRPTGSDTGLAAVTLGMGPEESTAPTVIVVNPSAAGSDPHDPSALEFVLTHEAVHALWRSPATPAPMWLEEGFADTVAAAAYPEVVRSDDSSLWADVRAHGAPRTFPPDEAFRPDAHHLDHTYALARSICTFIVGRWGWPAMTSIVESAGNNPGGDWWTVLGTTSLGDLEHQWSTWLTARARR